MGSMGTGMGMGPGCQVTDERLGITIATQHCTWVPVPGYGFEILVRSHIVTRPCETIPPLFMLCGNTTTILACQIATCID